jgi:hypothetical protein
VWGGSICLVGALLYLGAVRGPLIYDGSFFLYQILETQLPFIPDNRFLAVPVHIVTIGASHLTDDVWTLGLVFSVTYLAMAVGTFLGSAWWMSRQDGGLVVWPVLGLLLVSPILVDTTTESLATAGLAFAMTYIAATPKTRRRWVIAGVLAGLLFASHPYAGVVLAWAGGVAAYRWARSGRREVAELVFCGAAVVIGVIRLSILVPGYETAAAAPGALLPELWHLVLPETAALALGAWLCGIGLLLWRRGLIPVGAGPLTCLAPALGYVPLLVGLARGTGWPPPIAYRFATVPLVLPLLILLVIDLVTAGGDRAPTNAKAAYRAAAAAAMLAISAGLVLQGWRWNEEVSAMRAHVAATAAPCGPDFAGAAAIATWGGRSLAVLVQGREPRVVLGSQAECDRLISAHVYSGSNHFTALYLPSRGWFHLPRP